jgi:hypothetical protein
MISYAIQRFFIELANHNIPYITGNMWMMAERRKLDKKQKVGTGSGGG